MPGRVPFRFCRYQISIGEEILDAAGQTQTLTEMQGDEFKHGSGRSGNPPPNVLIMEPRVFECDEERCLNFSVGLRAGVRIVQGYNKQVARVDSRMQPDSHIKLARFVTIPHMGLMAVEDRASDTMINAQQALGSLRTIIRQFGGNQGNLDVIHLTDEDVSAALQQWELTQYDYVVSPLNPITAGELAERRSAAMKQENIGLERGTALPARGNNMHQNEGLIAETAALTEVGYGQNGFKGVTPDGHEGHIPKPRFHHDRHKNLAERSKPRFLRIYFQSDEDDISVSVARALMRFYNHGEQATDIP